MSTETDMGVTANAQLVLGYILGAISRYGERADFEGASYLQYRPIDDDLPPGSQTIENAANGNTYRVSVVQLTGQE